MRCCFIHYEWWRTRSFSEVTVYKFDSLYELFVIGRTLFSIMAGYVAFHVAVYVAGYLLAWLRRIIGIDVGVAPVGSTVPGRPALTPEQQQMYVNIAARSRR
jgi:hypothetical protein